MFNYNLEICTLRKNNCFGKSLAISKELRSARTLNIGMRIFFMIIDIKSIYLVNLFLYFIYKTHF